MTTKIYEYNDGRVKGTALYIENEKHIYLYDLIIPENLEEEFNMPKSSILRYHTSIKKVINVRKEPNEKRLEKELKKFLGVKNGK